jgi:outer membrane protein assembly factor BamB
VGTILFPDPSCRAFPRIIPDGEHRLFTLPSKKPILKAALFLTLASLLIAGCTGTAVNNWPTLAASEDAVYMAQMQLKRVDGATGALSWSYPEKADATHVFYGTPALANGWVIAGSYSEVVNAVDQQSGALIWANETHQGKGRFIAGPVVTNDMVLIPATDQYLYALDLASGKDLWKFKARAALWAPVAVDGHTAYLAGMDHMLYAIDLQNGQLQWELDLGGPMVHAPTLGDDGMIYTSTFNQEIVALDPNNQQVIWRTAISGKVWNAPLFQNGKLYFGTDQNKVYALDAKSGDVVWSRDTNGAVLGRPAMFGEGIAFVTEAGEVFTMALDGTPGWTRTVEGKLYSNPAVINGYLVVSGTEMSDYLVTFDANGTPGWAYGSSQN